MDKAPRERVKILKDLRVLLDKMDSSKVTLIGDIMLDRYHHGYSNRLISTAPVPVLKILRSEESPGAAAHIARGLGSLGLDVSIFSCVGDDREGEFIKNQILLDGLPIDGIETVKNRQTLTKIRFFGSRQSLLEKSQILLQADRESLEELDIEVSNRLVEKTLKSIPDSCALVISDYDKGVLTDEGSQKLIQCARENSIPSIVDPKLTGLERSRGATVVLFEIRGLDLLRRRLMLDSAEDTASSLIKTYNWESLIVLGGVDGVTLYEADGNIEFIACSAPSPSQQIGLHDAAATALAAALGNQFPMSSAVVLAAAACECVLTAQASHEFVNRRTLGLWLDELSWQMQISDR
jgi:D-beta-D-heptose 7-phosphate kinase/D-beta-D-heptose 1-phosphate adenosyltransferase